MLQIIILMIILQMLIGCGENVDVCNVNDKSKRGGSDRKTEIYKILQTDDKDFSGNYRIVGKNISFGDTTAIGITINRKPPTLAEYISSRDN